MKRRHVLALVAGTTASSGCLRLTGGGSTTTDPSTPEESPTASETPADDTPPEEGDSEVTLTERWTDENGVDNVWTADGTFYYNDYNYAAEASHGDGVTWSDDTTYDRGDTNFGADAFAADDRYAVFGYTPEDPEGSDPSGAHFHAYRRYDGEEAWVVSAPSDGVHKLAVGATMVGDTVVLAVSDYGGGNTGQPLVYGVDVETGDIRWETDQSVLPAQLIRYVDSYDGDVYVGVGGTQVLAGETGELIETHGSWYASSYRLRSLGRIHSETMFACATSFSRVAAHPLGENGLSWSNDGFESTFTSMCVDNSLVVVGTQAGEVYALERGSGETRWDVTIPNSVGGIETTGTRVWVGDSETGLTAYDRETGSVVHRSVKPVNGDDIGVIGDVLLLGGDTATAYTID